ncbi:MAG: hypothetical protein Fur0014_09440 [Rubrivivax sp.]
MNDARHLAWGAQELWQQLSPLLPGLSIEVMARLESTNTELLNRARAGDARGRRSDDTLPCLLVAEHQTHGRGRQGRDWVAAPGRSLTFSLLLKLAPVSWSGLSLAVGCALADALDTGSEPHRPRLALKWPNDLWLLDAPGRGRKLGGILIETVTVGTHRMAVVGVGLNVQPQPAEGLAHGYASLAELDPALDAPAVLATVARPLVQALQRFEAEGFPPFRAPFARRDLLQGQPLVALGAGAPLEGWGEGVDSDGSLLLRTADGRHHRIGSGEVSIRLR